MSGLSDVRRDVLPPQVPPEFLFGPVTSSGLSLVVLLVSAGALVDPWPGSRAGSCWCREEDCGRPHSSAPSLGQKQLPLLFLLQSPSNVGFLMSEQAKQNRPTSLCHCHRSVPHRGSSVQGRKNLFLLIMCRSHE